MGSFGGSLKDLSVTELGAAAIRAALECSAVPADVVDEVLMGCVLQANTGQAPARQAARYGGIPDTVPCTTVNKVCASGMKAVAQAVQSIRLGDTSIVVAGGMESMSRVPFYAAHMRWGHKFGDTSLADGLSRDGLTDAYDGKAMGLAAERCARDCGVSRAEQDAFAVESYHRSQAAWESGAFDAEVVAVPVPQRKGDPVVVARDEEPWNVRFDRIPTLSPAFDRNGSVTAANASTMNDGAAAIVLAERERAEQLGLRPLARILSYADAEQAPEWFTTTPSLALPRAVQKAGLQMADIDLWEINEAFSVVAIENMRRMQIDPARVNVHGGAVSLGHPLGCSGARILVTLVHALRRHGVRYGAAGICNGGGGASAIVVEAL
jgi:acetyl-CoA C-acetyltransferase